MFGFGHGRAACTTPAAITLAAPNPIEETTPHHVPDWLASCPVPVNLGHNLLDQLLDIHHKLLDEIGRAHV